MTAIELNKVAKSIHEGRLILLLFCLVAAPLYFILFFTVFFVPDIDFLGDWKITYMIFVNPFVFIIVWELFAIMFRNRIANSYERMKDIVSFVSIRYNLYYGLTALFFVFLFVFPLVTPVVSSLIMGALVWRIVTAKHDWEKNPKTPLWALIIVIAVMIIPLICNVYFYIVFIPQAWEFWSEIYLPYFVPVLQILAKGLATAVILGSIAYLLRFGTSEYELVFSRKEERPKEIGYIRAIQVGLFVLFVILQYIKNPIFNYIQYLAIALNVIVILGNLRKSKQIIGVRKSIFSYILVMILFIFSVMGQPVLEGIILVISSLVYIGTFSFVLVTTPDE